MSALINKSRLGWIDYARGFAIIFVVYRHMFEGLKNTRILQEVGVNVSSYMDLEKLNIFFFSFRMPLFFMVSGLFIQSSLVKRGLQALVENKFRTILYPYFVWGVIQVSMQTIFSAYTNSSASLTDISYLLYVPRNIAQFWYLYALFNVAVLFAFFRVKLKLTPAYQLILGVVFFFTSAVFSQYKIDLGFVNDILHYYIFLAIGDSISHVMLKGKLRSFLSTWKAAFILLVPFILSQAYFLSVNLDHHAESPEYLYVEYYQPVVFLFIALSGCAFIVSVSSLMERYEVMKWLRYLGEHSLYIYVMHVIVFAGVRVLLTKFFHLYDVYLLMLVCISSALIIPIVFYQLMCRFGLEILFSLEKKGKRKETVTVKSPTILQPTYENSNKL